MGYALSLAADFTGAIVVCQGKIGTKEMMFGFPSGCTGFFLCRYFYRAAQDGIQVLRKDKGSSKVLA